MTDTRFGRVQLRIMQVLWDRERCTARAITEALNKERPIAHSTVQTLLRKLEAKGAVGYEKEGRTFVFFATIQAQGAVKTVAREMIDRMFNGSASDLVCYLLKQENFDPAELKQIRDMIKKKGK